jgi:hypothetical protein
MAKITLQIKSTQLDRSQQQAGQQAATLRSYPSFGCCGKVRIELCSSKQCETIVHIDRTGSTQRKPRVSDNCSDVDITSKGFAACT